MSTFAAWTAAGQRIALTLPPHRDTSSTTYSLFYRTIGQGPWLTLLHGFPTYSRDWEAVVGHLQSQYRLLMVDLLGYGASDKPQRHRYATFEHADLIEALWAALGITQMGVIGHDVGGTLTQELLARQAAGPRSATITGAVFLNSAVYTEHYRPLPITVLLARPGIGPLVARALNERSYSRSLAAVFSPTHPLAPEDVHDYWVAMQQNQGMRNFSRLLHYLPDKRHYQPRWAAALQTTTIPVRFLWGLADPAVGASIVPDIRTHHPASSLVTYPDVGHFPHIEVAEQVAHEIATFFAA